MLCKRIGIVSDWDSWFGNSLHDSVKKYQMSDYFQNNNFVVEAAKVSITAMQKKIRRKRRRRRRTKHWRSIHGAGSAARRGYKHARRRRQDHTHTHTHRRVWVGTAPMHLYTGRSTRRTATDFANTSDDKLDIDASKQ